MCGFAIRLSHTRAEGEEGEGKGEHEKREGKFKTLSS